MVKPSTWRRRRIGAFRRPRDWAALTFVAFLSLAMPGCLGGGHAQSGALVEFQLVQDLDGLWIEMTGPPTFPKAFQVTVAAAGGWFSAFQESFQASDLLALGNNTFRVPHAYEVRGGEGFDVEALVAGRQVGGREFAIRDLGADELPGLRERHLGGIYALWYRQEFPGGFESQRGTEAVAVDPKEKATRLFKGSGTLTRAFGPLELSINLTRIERTVSVGKLVDEERVGVGNWTALGDATGNGTVTSFRQDFAGYDRLTLDGGPERAYRKQVTTASLKGTFSANGQTRVLDGPVFWTEWIDPETGRVAWVRQRPAALESSITTETSEGAAVHESGLSLAPWALTGKIPVPANHGDRMPLDFGAGRRVSAQAEVDAISTIMGRPMATRNWTSESDDYEFRLQVSADPALAGLPLLWEFRAETDHASWSASNLLLSLKNNR
jgi:hypothetical protein